MESFLFPSRLLCWKAFCVYPPPPPPLYALWHFFLKAPHAGTGNTSSLCWNFGRASFVHAGSVIITRAQKWKKQHVSTGNGSMRRRNVRMRSPTQSITHLNMGLVSQWLHPDQLSLPEVSHLLHERAAAMNMGTRDRKRYLRRLKTLTFGFTVTYQITSH